MLRAKQLRGRAVVDIDNAQRLGTVNEVFLDVNRRQVAGLGTSGGQLVPRGGRSRTFVPASVIQALGQDAITVGRSEASEPAEGREGLIPLSKLVGRMVVSHSGRMIGTIADVMLDDDTLRIINYTITSGSPGIARILSRQRRAKLCARADADLRFGPDLVIVPDDAIVQVTEERREAEQPIAGPARSVESSEAMPMPPPIEEPPEQPRYS